MSTLRSNVSVGVQYLEAWLGGMGCVPLENLMEDAATAEICRTQACPMLHFREQDFLSQQHNLRSLHTPQSLNHLPGYILRLVDLAQVPK